MSEGGREGGRSTCILYIHVHFGSEEWSQEMREFNIEQ